MRTAPGPYEVVELEVAEPQQGEVQVRMVAAGLCHSDDHIAVGDSGAPTFPFALGHEGAGVVLPRSAQESPTWSRAITS
ncbi:alcohol dehydrogenase catalytic domain-containing protein [Aeromicrobium sp. UC242_57]|uniref:alcohol dehydrogenase catalytic domain-containing protein n=1 Tax=Aeromicrobium sp. UC242_57 TaxID=3374624 RepID=UPI0037B881C8